MNKKKTLVELDRLPITLIGNSPYTLMPKFLRREIGLTTESQVRDFEAVYYRDPDSKEIIFRIEKRT